MEEVIPGLYASPPETLPFAPSLEVRAFLLRRDPGNLLIYGAGTLTADAREIEGVGGVSRRFAPLPEPPPRGCVRRRPGRLDFRRAALVPRE